MSEFTRRRFLGGAGAAAAGGAAASLLPVSVQKALATPPNRPGRLSDIKHVVLLMQENRSFDHYFGTLSGVAGFDDPHAITLPTGRSVFYQPDPVNPDGYLLPFHLDTRSTNAQRIPTTNHEYDVQHQAWNGGKMDNWLPAHRAADKTNGPYVMGYYTREDIPFQFALADAFTICDQYHSSVMGPTWSNRLYWNTGTIDPNGENGGPVTYNGHPNGQPYTWTTYAERLDAAGISWKDYHYGSGLVAHGMLPQFKAFQDALPGSSLYERGVALSSVGQFEYDALHDKLPTVSWLCPPDGASEHPAEPGASPAQGAAFVAATIAAIAANPDVWAKTVVIINYDENDGLFDHVVPPTPAPGTPDEYVDGVPIGAGFRVPCMVVSPWSAGGYVCSEKFDHTSVLRFLEKVTGVMEPNISAWRRRTFGDLTRTLRFNRGTPAPVMPNTGGNLNLATYEVAQLPPPAFPGAKQTVPHQERGHRPRS
ncbi:alkaline phosphatase family protein [Rugosimonospora africana]|uniref:phospholipase C n=1 Tax=Rugosimonospora africana TaxID=556532 RepID=A0A8J3QYU2_9ACTN|nr:alkaline phosphatase family protein [Rugosimonospora africana]GIH19774.1 putative non-hemolytic phospholipase C [Rugosimonospora africana]